MPIDTSQVLASPPQWGHTRQKENPRYSFIVQGIVSSLVCLLLLTFQSHVIFVLYTRLGFLFALSRRYREKYIHSVLPESEVDRPTFNDRYVLRSMPNVRRVYIQTF